MSEKLTNEEYHVANRAWDDVKKRAKIWTTAIVSSFAVAFIWTGYSLDQMINLEVQKQTEQRLRNYGMMEDSLEKEIGKVRKQKNQLKESYKTTISAIEKLSKEEKMLSDSIDSAEKRLKDFLKQDTNKIAEVFQTLSKDNKAAIDNIAAALQANNNIQSGEIYIRPWPNKSWPNAKIVFDIQAPKQKNWKECENNFIRRGLLNQEVEFKPAYQSRPTVILSLGSVDVKGQYRVSTELVETTTEGFKYNFYTWCDTKMYSGRMRWIAYGK